jgi:hypothetical protein
MKKLNFYHSILLAALLLSSCDDYYTPEELKNKFYSNKQLLTKFTSKLETDKNFDSVFQIEPYSPLPNFKSIYPEEFPLLEQVGINSVTSQTGRCLKCPRCFILKTNWPSKHNIFLIYNEKQYDSIENEKGFYKIDEYKNETWGLGDNWKMFRFVDTIRNIKY